VVAVTVSALVPKPTGTLAEKDPSDPAVVLVTVAASPVVLSAASIDTADPGVVVPVTVVVAVVSVARRPEP